MKPTIQLINALRKAAGKVVTGEYRWLGKDTCNCGILAKELLGKDFKRLVNSDMVVGCWTMAANRSYGYCESTGMPLPKLYAMLEQAGFQFADFRSIEFLANDDVLDRLGGRDALERGIYGIFDNPENVARYFRAQADILEEQLGEQWESRPLISSPKQSKGVEA